jgi:hypothetical protein
MPVIIKDFEMPEYCAVCPFIAATYQHKLYCNLRETENAVTNEILETKQRPAWCPLVEIKT